MISRAAEMCGEILLCESCAGTRILYCFDHVFVLGSCLEWPEVPTVFVLANFRPAFGTSDGVGSAGVRDE